MAPFVFWASGDPRKGADDEYTSFFYTMPRRARTQSQASLMLQTLHDRFSGPVTWIVLGLITVIFGGFFGVQSYMNTQNETFVARVDGHEISQQEFRERYNMVRSQMQR